MTTISLRVRDDELAEIDRRAAEAGLTRTALMLRAVLDAATADEKRFYEIEDRIERLERAASLGMFG
jgi:uncharacterized protein (DUF1778 family)